jgi:hypothetical protein
LAKELAGSPSYLSQVMSRKRTYSSVLLSRLHEVLSNERRSVEQNTNSGFDATATNSYNIPNGPLAQLAEQLTLNQPVPGSSPGRLISAEIKTGGGIPPPVQLILGVVTMSSCLTYSAFKAPSPAVAVVPAQPD